MEVSEMTIQYDELFGVSYKASYRLLEYKGVEKLWYKLTEKLYLLYICSLKLKKFNIRI